MLLPALLLTGLWAGGGAMGVALTLLGTLLVRLAFTLAGPS